MANMIGLSWSNVSTGVVKPVDRNIQVPRIAGDIEIFLHSAVLLLSPVYSAGDIVSHDGGLAV